MIQHRPLTWESSNCKVALWASFYKTVNIQTEKPALICKLCDKNLEHSTLNDAETNDITKHTASKVCKINWSE